MKEYVKPAIVIEEIITFETAHSDPQCPSWHHYPGEGETGLGHLGCWLNKACHWNN